ncbi:MAG: (E)-4-hydroxy-3-methylbut-2-enyl-diphosphate synthase [Termitinemataceae bacterium]|nr:MAG: (E)-4-hydroxy-3-methylbut-2-enyl-diphosphate synthase [Termitinemataceae bacterium]
MNTVKVGGFADINEVFIGSDHPVSIQTMWKDKLLLRDTSEKKYVVERIEGLSNLGCSILRFSVPDIESADVLGKLCTLTTMPLVADIHFDYKIALHILDFPISKIRINPGNIGSKEKIHTVLQKALDKNVPVRIGVNGGSMPVDLRKAVDDGIKNHTEALIEAAERELAIFDEHNFNQVIVSIKASSVKETIAANTAFAARNDVPLHVGVTEAGPLIAGVVRNTAALYNLLCQGIGNTIRISLSDTMEKEVIAGREILLAVNECCGGVRIISCPRCGRCSFDTHLWTEKWQTYLYSLRKNITVAFMGCPVNGPGEARNADIGITGSDSKVLIFCNGKIKHRLDAALAEKVFKEELDSI